jgi:hypothetical protein
MKNVEKIQLRQHIDKLGDFVNKVMDPWNL